MPTSDLPKKSPLRSSASLSSLRAKTTTTRTVKTDSQDLPFLFPSSHKSAALGLFFASTLTIKQESDNLLNSGPTNQSSQKRQS